MRGAYQEAVSLSLSLFLILSLSLFIALSHFSPLTMALRECAPWIFETGFWGSPVPHEVTSSEASAVQRLFSSDDPNSLSKAEKEKELKEKDSSGDLPLHFVAAYAKGKYALSVFRSIFNAYPSAAEEKDKDGHLPLHYVANCMGDGDGGLEAMQLLLTEYPQAAKEKNRGGDLPIHWICRYNSNATLAMVRELLSAHPQSINEKGSSGKKPYALAVSNNDLPADAIEYLRCAEQGERVCQSQPCMYTLSVSLFSLSLSIPSSLHTQTLSQLFFSLTLSVCTHILYFFSVLAPTLTLERRPCAIARLLYFFFSLSFPPPVLNSLISTRHTRCARFHTHTHRGKQRERCTRRERRAYYYTRKLHALAHTT